MVIRRSPVPVTLYPGRVPKLYIGLARRSRQGAFSEVNLIKSRNAWLGYNEEVKQHYSRFHSPD